MPIFKSDPAKQFAKDDAAQRKLRADHVSAVDEARAKASAAKAEDARLLDAGASEDDPAVQAARKIQSEAEATITKRTDAIARVDAKLAEIAAGMAGLDLDKRKQEYVVEAERRTSVLEERTRVLLESIAAWIPAAADVAEISLDAAGLPLYGEKSLVELPPAVDMAAQTVRGRIILDVLAGNKPPVIASKPTLVPAVLAPAEPPSFALFALQHLRYQRDGREVLVARFDLAQGLTASQRNMALLELKIAVDLDDERISELRKRQVSQIVQRHLCWDIDTGAAPAGSTIMPLPTRERHTPKYHPPTGTPELPVAAARNEGTDHD
jgi:hypothetical protein